LQCNDHNDQYESEQEKPNLFHDIGGCIHKTSY
jgi:hypothetical protein